MAVDPGARWCSTGRISPSTSRRWSGVSITNTAATLCFSSWRQGDTRRRTTSATTTISWPCPAAIPTAAARSLVVRKTIGQALTRYFWPNYYIARWLLRGRRGAPPPFLKHRVIARYARRYRLRTLVETGTYRGDTIAAVSEPFD